jgi:hypothetical protein
MGKNVDILKINDPNFKEELELTLNTEGSASDYRNDRERPYNGQPHTTEGVRGAQEVKGITFRDLKDCFVQAMLVSSGKSELSDKVFEKDEEFKGTKYAAKGTWRASDVYNVDDFDPIAVAQNLCCFVEHYMGIYPNVNLDGIPTLQETIGELFGGEDGD